MKPFDRLGRGLRLTAPGGHLLHYAEKILDLADGPGRALSKRKTMKDTP